MCSTLMDKRENKLKCAREGHTMETDLIDVINFCCTNYKQSEEILICFPICGDADLSKLVAKYPDLDQPQSTGGYFRSCLSLRLLVPHTVPQRLQGRLEESLTAAITWSSLIITRSVSVLFYMTGCMPGFLLCDSLYASFALYDSMYVSFCSE